MTARPDPVNGCPRCGRVDCNAEKARANPDRFDYGKRIARGDKARAAIRRAEERCDQNVVDWRAEAAKAEARLAMATRFDLDRWPNSKRVVTRRRDGRWDASTTGHGGRTLSENGYATADEAFAALAAEREKHK